MLHTISILIRADVGRDVIELFISGCLTADTFGVLATQIEKARDLDPSAPILVDLTDAQHLEPEALEHLRSQVQAEEARGHPAEPSLRLVTPQATPSCPLSGADQVESP